MTSTRHDAAGSRSSDLIGKHVEYRHHPLHGRHVIDVIAVFATAAPPWANVELDDGSRRGVPIWMLDRAHCATLVDVVEPRLDPKALRTLRSLVDGQGTLLDTSPQSASGRRAAGGTHAAGAE